MKEEKFKVIQFIRELILRVDRELENFPKKEMEIKNRIRTSTYDILELSYEANTALEIEHKKKLLVKIISKIKIIDFLLNLSYDKALITEKKYYKLAQRLDDIAKYTNGWLKNIVGHGWNWLASPSANNTSNVMNVNYNGNVNNNNYNNNNIGVRPAASKKLWMCWPLVTHEKF